MGVHGIWELLDPVGSRVSVETLSGKKLAIGKMEKYEVVKDLGAGNFGVARLLRHKDTKELVAMKYIERGHKIDENVAREIISHKSLRHPNIIRFKEATIVMEYAAGGELFDRICSAGRFSENEEFLVLPEGTFLGYSPGTNSGTRAVYARYRGALLSQEYNSGTDGLYRNVLYSSKGTFRYRPVLYPWLCSARVTFWYGRLVARANRGSYSARGIFWYSTSCTSNFNIQFKSRIPI
ncbi:hypothetical protein GOBAR_DD16778 [Gossypium barbadense]|nr:hypothetical protein GOBAR_DD16778 [Gossypium barbadense]